LAQNLVATRNPTMLCGGVDWLGCNSQVIFMS